MSLTLGLECRQLLPCPLCPPCPHDHIFLSSVCSCHPAGIPGFRQDGSPVPAALGIPKGPPIPTLGSEEPDGGGGGWAMWSLSWSLVPRQTRGNSGSHIILMKDDAWQAWRLVSASGEFRAGGGTSTSRSFLLLISCLHHHLLAWEVPWLLCPGTLDTPPCPRRLWFPFLHL